jgi:hypothetical protein
VSEVTRILDRVQQGDAKAAEELLPLTMSKLDEKVEAIFEAALALETDAQRVDYLNRA